MSDKLREILESQNIWPQIFDKIRLVDGNGSFSVCEWKDGQWEYSDEKCYHFWNRSSKCQNCVCMQASHFQKQMVKLEYFNEMYYLVIAKPIEYDGKNFIVEFMTNITQQLATENEEGVSDNFISDLMNQLEKVSSRDSFTGLYNKAYMIEELERQLQSAKDSQQPFYVALIDVDNFKMVNDSFGHILGDQAILNISKILMNKLKPEDGIATRFGGDEFGILFYNTNYEACITILNDIKNEVDQYIYETAEADIKISISCGLEDVATENTFEESISKVDKSLYASKRRDKQNIEVKKK